MAITISRALSESLKGYSWSNQMIPQTFLVMDSPEVAMPCYAPNSNDDNKVTFSPVKLEFWGCSTWINISALFQAGWCQPQETTQPWEVVGCWDSVALLPALPQNRFDGCWALAVQTPDIACLSMQNHAATCMYQWPINVCRSAHGTTCNEIMYSHIYIYIESCLIPVTVKKRDFHIGTPQKVHKAKCFFWELAIGDLSGMICVCVCVASCHFACSSSCFLVGCLVPFCVLQFVLFGGLPRAILRAPVRAFWWVASCHFACSSSCFLVGCLVPFWVLQFVLFGGLPRATLRAPVRAFWRVASCHFACSSSCFLVVCLVPLWRLQIVLFGGLPRALLRAPVCAFWWVASCHFACSSSCFLVGCLVSFWVLQFVLFGGLPRAILRAPVRAFWWVASCHFACSSSCFLVGCLVPFCVLQFVLFGGLPRAILRAPVCASN